MKISIITTCYNRQSVIRRTIESVLAQDYPDIEYIVVDGNSTDGSMDIVHEYKDRISRIICEPDRGMYEAINKGIRTATGDVVGLMHSDDFFYDIHTVSDIAEAFKNSNADMIYGNGMYVDYDNTELIVRKWISGKYSCSKVKNGWLPLHPTVYIKRKKMMEKGLYDESYRIAADSELLVRYLHKRDLKVHYLDRFITMQRMGGLSTNPNLTKLKWSEDLKLYKEHGINPYWALRGKILSKIPQYIKAKMPWNKVPINNQENLIKE